MVLQAVKKMKEKGKLKMALGKMAKKTVEAAAVKKKAKLIEEKVMAAQQAEALEAEWPLKTKVRVIDEALKEVYFGMQATVQKHVGGKLEVVSNALKKVTVDPCQVMKVDGLKAKIPQKHLNSLTVEARRHLLYEAGYGQESETDFKDFKKDIEGEDPVRLWNGHVALYQSFLQWSLEVSEDLIQLVHPIPLLGWLEGCEGEGDLEILQNFRTTLQAQAKTRGEGVGAGVGGQWRQRRAALDALGP